MVNSRGAFVRGATPLIWSTDVVSVTVFCTACGQCNCDGQLEIQVSGTQKGALSMGLRSTQPRKPLCSPGSMFY